MALVSDKNRMEAGAAIDAPYDAGAATIADEAFINTYHFPAEMIGGSCPHVKGEEEALAWNAAAEACASERIHLIWREHDNRVWYLAVRSSDMASHASTWCPFASVLPGCPDARPAPVVYTYYSDEAATLMAVDRDSLRIIRGTSSVIKAKAERLAREMNGAEIVDLVPDTIITMKAVMWDSLSLLENRARRFFAVASVMSAIVLTLLAVFIWFSASIMQLGYKSELKDLQERTNIAVMQLQQTAQVLRTSEMREQVAAFVRLNESLIGVQGWMKLYLLQGGNLRWWAVVPPNLTSERIQEIGAQTIENSDDGLVIANSKESYMRKGALKQP